MNKFKILSVSVVLSLFSTLSLAEISVIGSASLGVDSITKDQVESLFLGKSSDIQGVDVSILDLSGSESARSEFMDSILGKTESQLKAYWSRQVFTGKGQPPKKGSTDEAINFVKTSKNGVSYVDSGSVLEGVKVLGTF